MQARETCTGEGVARVCKIDGDPFIVYNGKMKQFAQNLFTEAEKLGYSSMEDKARYLSGRIFELSPFGLHKNVTKKNAIELFDGLMSIDKEQHLMACINKAILQRGLLESQGVRTRNHMYQILPFTYAFKPDTNAPTPFLSETLKRMNVIMPPIIKPLVDLKIIPSFPHATVDVCTRENERRECTEWKTLDATFDDTTRMLKVRPLPDDRYYLSESIPKTVTEWFDKYVRSSPIIKFLYENGENPPWNGLLNWVFQTLWFNPLMDANKHIELQKQSQGVLKK